MEKENKNQHLKVLAIVGPTGAGKSAVGLEFAKKSSGEIISADSMLVYRDMDIGTDKPTQTILKKIPHHLINVVDIKEAFSVARYQKMARQAIADISGRGKLPIIVGGSGLYIRAALDPLEFPPGNLSSAYREQLKALFPDEPDRLWQELNKIDPQAAATIPPQNMRRVIRALEVIKETGELFSEKLKRWQEKRSIYDAFFVGLRMNRAGLHRKIEERVDRMIRRGFLNEVKELAEKSLTTAETARQALGYKELLEHLQGDISLEEAISLIKRHSKQFAKRQLTWFGADPRINWVSSDNKNAEELAEEIRSLVSRGGFIVM